MLMARARVKEAMELADKVKAENAPDWPAVEIAKARTLYFLGEKDKAKAIFDQRAAAIEAGSDFTWLQALIDSENRVGLRDLAFEHAARILGVSGGRPWAPPLLAKLYPKNADSAAVLWRILAAEQGGANSAAAVLKQLRGLLDGTADARTVADLADKAEAEFKVSGAADELAARRRALAEAALVSKNEAAARSLLEKAGTADALIRLGDLEADKKEWDKAEKWYARAWEKDHARPLALFLDGYALAQAGKEEEGKKRMELAHWTPLGDSAARFALLKDLSDHGQHEAVRREAELLARLSPAGTLYASEGRRLAGQAAASAASDYAAAADGLQRSMLRVVARDIHFLQPLAYLTVPALVHRYRVEQYIAAGKLDEARKEAELGLAAVPGDGAFPIALVPALDKAGRKKEGQELFDRCLAVQEDLCKEFPNSSSAHNAAAWLAARCCRHRGSSKRHRGGTPAGQGRGGQPGRPRRPRHAGGGVLPALRRQG